MFINKNKVKATVEAQVASVKRNIGKVITVAFNNTPRSKANYCLVYFNELKSKRSWFAMCD